MLKLITDGLEIFLTILGSKCLFIWTHAENVCLLRLPHICKCTPDDFRHHTVNPVLTGLNRPLKRRPKIPHRRHCVVSLSKNINPSLVLVQPRKTCRFITERLLMGRKESNQATQNKRQKIGFQDRLLLIAGQKYCRMIQQSILQYFRPSLSYLNHLSLSTFEWPLETGFTVVTNSIPDQTAL